jgi:ribonuclease BN (tRNA processing enzyme)
MKITFIGTSHGVPGPDRYCQSIFIETDHSSYIVDAGAPVINWMLANGRDLSKLKAVFVTHTHGDHTSGLYSLLDLASWYYKDMDFDVYLTEQVFIDATTQLMTACFGSTNFFPNDRVRLRLIESLDVYQDSELKVTAFPTNHMKNRPAYGFLLEADGKKVYISGDLSGSLDDYPAFLNESEVDILVIECAHFPAERLLNKLCECKAKRIMPVHVWTLDKYDILKDAASEIPGALILPNDNDWYEV